MVIPEAVRRAPEAVARWRALVEHSQLTYRQLLDDLEATIEHLPPRERLRLLRTAARSVLPGATETKLVFTANARSLRHFLSQRGGILGDEEMRLVSALLLKTMHSEAPSLFADLRVEHLADGIPLVRLSSG